jgi:hypothetical protein
MAPSSAFENAGLGNLLSVDAFMSMNLAVDASTLGLHEKSASIQEWPIIPPTENVFARLKLNRGDIGEVLCLLPCFQAQTVEFYPAAMRDNNVSH